MLFVWLQRLYNTGETRVARAAATPTPDARSSCDLRDKLDAELLRDCLISQTQERSPSKSLASDHKREREA